MQTLRAEYCNLSGRNCDDVLELAIDGFVIQNQQLVEKLLVLLEREPRA